MNVLMLGNGFDLYYKLPTKYNNFLKVANFLREHYDSSTMKTVGDILGSTSLLEQDKFIDCCYKEHKNKYDRISLNTEQVQIFLNLVKSNIWFDYLYTSFNKDVGWIDFEKEIVRITSVFQDIFENLKGTHFELDMSQAEQFYLLKKFNFFIKDHRMLVGGKITYNIDDRYLFEEPFGSKVYIVQKGAIIKELFLKLQQLAESFKLYLKIFVESTLPDEADLLSNFKPHQALLYADNVVTLNYTHTYESIYSEGTVFHLHGDTSYEIILGINSDENDTVGTIDTSFVSFKKYYQRALYETDVDYLSWLRKKPQKENKINLVVMGHSLDITDQDIISALFDMAYKITILYHNDDAKASYIKNLITIFGMENFNLLRNEKFLSFMSVDGNFTAFANSMKNSSEAQLKTLL